MSGPWNEGALWHLLRFASKNSGPWDDFEGELPSEDDAKAIVEAAAELASLRARVGELVDLLNDAEASLTAVAVHCVQPSMACDALRLLDRIRPAIDSPRRALAPEGEEEKR